MHLKSIVVLTVLLAAFVAPGVGTPARAEEAPADSCLRIGVAVRIGEGNFLTPLVYWGGFQTKTACYEGLTRFGQKGELLPNLAESWKISSDGLTYRIKLRDGVVCHDGRPLDAETVRNHLMRWRGNFSNSWIGSTLRFDEIRALDDCTVEVTLHEPWPFLEECAAAINPAFVVGKGAYTNEGAFVRTVGTGPYELVASEPGQALRFRANPRWWRGSPTIPNVELVPLPDGHRESTSAVELLASGQVDLVADGSDPLIPRTAIEGVLARGGYRLHCGPGTAVTYLVLNMNSATFADVDARRSLAAAIDRQAFVSEGELGYAVPATTLFAPGWSGWPKQGKSTPPSARKGNGRVRILVGAGASDRMVRHARILERQANDAGFAAEVVAPGDSAGASDSGEWEIRFSTTYGAPYDPWVTLQTTFLDRPEGETASSRQSLWPDPALRQELMDGFTSPRPDARKEAFAKIQSRLDDQVPLLPLFISDRIALSTDAVEKLPVHEDGYDLNLGFARTAPLPARPSLLAPAPAGPPPLPEQPEDPSKGEVSLPALGGWKASLVLDNQGVGVWALGCFQVYPLLGMPEVVGVDDNGTCHVLTGYSGRWSDTPIIKDGKWFNSIAHGDVDPRIEGAELYVGGQMGNVYQVIPHRHRRLDFRLISFLRGYEANIITAGDFLPESPGEELLVFTNPPAVVMLTPTGEHGTFVARDLGDVPGLVRETVILPRKPGEPLRVACVSRAGWLRLLTITPDGKLEWEPIYHDQMGLGRITMRPAGEGKTLVLYTNHDDGRVLRHEQSADGTWTTETIYLGPLGPRGLAAGRFDDDPATETVAIFGYSHQVEMLTRRDGRWAADTIFVEIDKGHALLTAELDGRNSTDELLLSGYGGRIVLLQRPVGYGRTEAAREE